LDTSKAFHYALLNEAIVAAIAAIGRTTDRHDGRVVEHRIINNGGGG